MIATKMSSIFFSLALLPLTCSTKIIQFSSQQEEYVQKSQHISILETTQEKPIPEEFTLCSAIFIRYFRGQQSFFSLYKGDNRTLWFSLNVAYQNLEDDRYTVYFNMYGKGMNLKTNTMKLRPFDWSFACISINQTNGDVTIVINGKLMLEEKITNEDFLSNPPSSFEENLVLGASTYQPKGAGLVSSHSEASVTSVNIHSVALSLARLEEETSGQGPCTPGSLMAWNQMQWRKVGAVQILEEEGICNSQPPPITFLFASFLTSWKDCMLLCPRFHRDGRVPYVDDTSQSIEQMARYINITNSVETLYAPFWKVKNSYVDYYTKQKINPILFLDGYPNGLTCSAWIKGNREGKLYDVKCNVARHCQCQFPKNPVLRLRGLCSQTRLETHYTLQHIDKEDTVYRGLTNSIINYEGDETESLGHWIVKSCSKDKCSTALSEASHRSYILGKQSWTITNDTCNRGKTYTKDLKMTGCVDGQFTCDNGDCVKMEKRCDQAPNCEDNSDEQDCSTVVLEHNYKKMVTPVLLDDQDEIIPAKVDVTFAFLGVVGIRESENQIDIKFRLQTEWTDYRVKFNNLKKLTEHNKLPLSEVQKIWIPNLIYKNTKNNDNTLDSLESASVTVKKEGNMTRSGQDETDEVEYFKGAENPIKMYQSFTKTFECVYHLKAFPFDTQTCSIDLKVGDLDSIELVPGKIVLEGDRELTQYFIVSDPASPTIEYKMKENGDNHKEVMMKIIFKRRMTPEAMSTFFPSMLLVSISYFTAFFKLPSFFNTAITVNLTVMLTITTLLISVRNKLPTTSYIKWIEYWLIFAQLVPFVQVILITSIEWCKDKKTELCPQITKVSMRQCQGEVQGLACPKIKVLVLF